ncbi:MAG: 4Fe-4S cluster-binding domain-containing protein [Clostridiales bacterium]|nr:4Fe-4S cluster-binding domain-containing protein [Clostridiales bacterium]
MKCYDCPRGCGADRDNGKIGLCGGGKYARIAKVIDNFTYEEPCLGSEVTAVFFGGCALGCSYCQNYKISRGKAGEEYSDEKLAALFDCAQNHIDLVTPSHYLTAIERALHKCDREHMFIYNTSGYETVQAVDRASAFTGVFLADFKYADSELASKLSRAPDYFSVAVKALQRMRENIQDEWAEVDGQRILKRGLIVRHLVLPEQVKNSIAVLDTIKSILGEDTVISLMSQFTPNGVGEPTKRLRKIEYKLVVEHAQKLGFDNGYIQEFSSADGKYTPDF